MQPDNVRDTIAPEEVQYLADHNEPLLILDVRTGEEYSGPTGHIAGAELIPVHELGARLGELSPHKQKTIVVVCRSGSRSAWATSVLRDRGYSARNMLGGMLRWNAEHRPIDTSENM